MNMKRLKAGGADRQATQVDRAELARHHRIGEGHAGDREVIT